MKKTLFQFVNNKIATFLLAVAISFSQFLENPELGMSLFAYYHGTKDFIVNIAKTTCPIENPVISFIICSLIIGWICGFILKGTAKTWYQVLN